MINDLLWQFFHLSVTSANASSLVRPFPAAFYDEHGTKDFERLVEQVHVRSGELVKFVASVMPVIKRVHCDEVIRGLFKRKKTHRPDLVFHVAWPESKEARFKQQLQSSSRVYAFHGSKAENFYSILQHGLTQCLNKRNVFGDGTYLTSEIEIALEFAPNQLTPLLLKPFNVHSLQCVAVCEVARDAKGVATSRSKRGTPDAYFVVTNDECVLVRYLCVYTRNAPVYSGFGVFTVLCLLSLLLIFILRFW